MNMCLGQGWACRSSTSLICPCAWSFQSRTPFMVLTKFHIFSLIGTVFQQVVSGAALAVVEALGFLGLGSTRIRKFYIMTYLIKIMLARSFFTHFMHNLKFKGPWLSRTEDFIVVALAAHWRVGTQLQQLWKSQGLQLRQSWLWGTHLGFGMLWNKQGIQQIFQHANMIVAYTDPLHGFAGERKVFHLPTCRDVFSCSIPVSVARRVRWFSGLKGKFVWGVETAWQV